jgi:putative MFS transporter
MWFLNLPTGLILIGLSPLLPESARFLQHMGRFAEAHATMARFGAVPSMAAVRRPAPDVYPQSLLPAPIPDMLGTTVALTLTALAWGFVNFGVLLWLPSSLVAEGRSVGVASTLIARSTLIAAPTVAVAAYLYSVWSTKSALLLAIGVTTLGLIAVLLRSTAASPLVANPLVSVALLIVGSSGVISILLPYAAENYPIRVRGRATGWVAGWSKVGGLIAQAFGVAGLVPALGIAAALVAIPAVFSLALIWIFGRETRGRDLRDLEVSPARRVISTDAMRAD